MPVFLKRKPADHLGVLRGEPPKRLVASFLHVEKGRGRAWDVLFRRTAFFMRGQPAIPVFFRSGLRATPFLDAKKGGKEASGGKAP